MFSQLRQHFGTAGLVVAIVALIAALAGGAIAASGGSGDNATASAKGKKGPRGKRGPAGKTGPTGPAGPVRPQRRHRSGWLCRRSRRCGEKRAPERLGRPGPAAPPGAAGTTGATGVTGQAGTTGATGSPWAVGGTLPAGATETGTYALSGVFKNLGEMRSDISFTIPLAGALDASKVHAVFEGEEFEGFDEETLEPIFVPATKCLGPFSNRRLRLANSASTQPAPPERPRPLRRFCSRAQERLQAPAKPARS